MCGVPSLRDEKVTRSYVRTVRRATAAAAEAASIKAKEAANEGTLARAKAKRALADGKAYVREVGLDRAMAVS